MPKEGGGVWQLELQRDLPPPDLWASCPQKLQTQSVCSEQQEESL